MASYNKVILIGNLTAEPELKTTTNGTSVTSFTVAVQRRYAKDSDEVKADFINCVAWRQSAEFITKYFSKGSNIIIEGAIQTRSYTTQDGTKRTVTEVVCDNVQFGAQKEKKSDEPHFVEVSPEEELPF